MLELLVIGGALLVFVFNFIGRKKFPNHILFNGEVMKAPHRDANGNILDANGNIEYLVNDPRT